MGCCGKVFLILLGIAAIYIGIKIHDLNKIPEKPVLENTWWGKGKPGNDDATIKPFKINIDEKVLVDLKERLTKTRSNVPSLEGTQQQYGINSKLLGEIVDFWKTKYNWKEREVYLNKFPQFTTQVQGLNIHYIHAKPTKVPKGVNVVPLLLVHGWPGSIREFYEIIPFLTTVQPNKDFVFEVIAPSLPGYGFSEAAVRPGLGAAQMSVVFKNLMARLDFKKYYLQGGDWGSLITRNMAILYPEHVLGLHSNFCNVQGPVTMFKIFLGSFFPSLVVDSEHAHKMYPLGEKYLRLFQESGYMHLQATKPDTVGVGLNDSPVGLAAYILEKFTSWTNPSWQNMADGGLTKKFTFANLLDNVMVYWVTNSITTSMRLYAETLNITQQALQLDALPVLVPTACARFSYELMYAPDSILENKFINLVQTTDYDDGGHFAAFEVPKELAEDIWSGVTKMRVAKRIPM